MPLPSSTPAKGISGASRDGVSRRIGMDTADLTPTVGRMAKGFLPYTIDPRLLLPPDLREWLRRFRG